MKMKYQNNSKNNQAAEEITVIAVSIVNGIITLIEPDSGEIGVYRQRGLNKLSNFQKRTMIYEYRVLDKDYMNYDELPDNYNIEFKDESEMGIASPRFEKYWMKNMNIKEYIIGYLIGIVFALIFLFILIYSIENEDNTESEKYRGGIMLDSDWSIVLDEDGKISIVTGID